MGIHWMQKAISFLDHVFKTTKSLSLRVVGQAVSYALSAVFCAVLSGQVYGYTVVQTSPSAPAGTEQTFIANTTSYFSASVSVNPFIANTYSILLQGPNPNYNPLPTNADLLNAIVTVSTYGYVFGYGGGMIYQNTVDSDIATEFGINCSSPTLFLLNKTSTLTFNTATCDDVTATIVNALFQVNLSTPPVLPFEP